jgi:hypothetical protein
MKRILLVAVSSSALAIAAPGVASAHHRHGKHHARRHGARVHVLDFRASAPATTTPANSPTTPAAPTPETAGTVASFKEGTLTITLNNGTSVSGKVTERTEIHCTPATPPAATEDSDDQGDGEHGSSGEGESEHSAHQAAAHAASNSSDNEEGQQDSDDESSSCTPATALVAGTPVREAELSIGPLGNVWDHVDVIH